MDKEIIKIPKIELRWSKWYPWNDIKIDARTKRGIKIPNKTKGVYEAKYHGSDKRLTIGKASDLRLRVRQGLVKGFVPHSSGKRIRAKEDISRIVVRWAVTDRPSTVEEELHNRYKKKFGVPPEHTKHT